VDCLVKEVIKIQLNKNYCNRDGGFTLSQALSHVTNMLKNIKVGQSRVGLATSYNRQVYHEADRFWSSQLPDDEYRYGPKYIGLFNIPPCDVAASLRTFY
jgi:hypothetical protein